MKYDKIMSVREAVDLLHNKRIEIISCNKFIPTVSRVFQEYECVAIGLRGDER